MCLHFELQWASCKLYAATFESGISLEAYQTMYLSPAIALICAGLAKLKDEVNENPELYRSILASIAREDRIIYDASFRKYNQVDGNAIAYQAMLAKCTAFEQQVTSQRPGQRQPTSDLIRLVLMTRECIPTFKTTVDGVVQQARSIAEATEGDLAVLYRKHDQTKSPYRLIEKGLTKGPNSEYPDCSQILDVFGCIIDCQDYTCAAAVVDAFADQQMRGLVRIVRVKDRYSNPSGGGWRDLMVNVAINGVIFEIQIVLHSMYVARSALDAHTAYNKFRCFAEVFGILKLPFELSVPVLSQQQWAELQDAQQLENERLVARVAELEATNDQLMAENKQLKNDKEELATLVLLHERANIAGSKDGRG